MGGRRSLAAAAFASVLLALAADAAAAVSPGASAASWTFPRRPPLPAYVAVAFPRPREGFLGEVFGRAGARLLRTEDDGRSWRVVWRGRAVSMALTFASGTSGWLVLHPCAEGCAPTLRTSLDGGRHWQAAALPAGTVGALPAGGGVGYAWTRNGPCGEWDCPTALWRTGDDGRRWRRVGLPGLSVSGVAALGRRLVLVGGLRCHGGSCRAVLMRSLDGGQSWETVLAPPGGDYQGNSGPFAVSLEGSVAYAEAPIPGGGSMASGVGALYRSTDEGRTWRLVAPAFGWGGAVVGGPGFPGVPVAATDTRAVSVVGTGAGAAEGGVALTLDGGRRWLRVDGLYGQEVYAASWDGPAAVWLVGARVGSASPAPFLVRLTLSPSGAISQHQLLPPPTPLLPLPGPSRQLLFGAGLPGEPGALLRSQDGGRRWTVAGEIRDADVLGGAFLTARVGSVYGLLPAASQEGIWQSRDGGQSWRLVWHGAASVLALRMTSPERGERIVTVGGATRSVWQVSEDGGRNWRTRATLPWPYGPEAAGFGPGGVAWAAILHGGRWTIEESRDDGRTWHLLGTIAQGYPAFGATPSWAVASGCAAFNLGNRLYVTRDGGRKWLRLTVTGGVAEGAAFLPHCTLVTTQAEGPPRVAALPG